MSASSAEGEATREEEAAGGDGKGGQAPGTGGGDGGGDSNPPPEELPPGWRKVPSQSRPGRSSYENIKAGQRYDRLPNSAFK